MEDALTFQKAFLVQEMNSQDLRVRRQDIEIEVERFEFERDKALKVQHKLARLSPPGLLNRQINLDIIDHQQLTLGYFKLTI